MRAVVHRRYGPPEVLQLAEVERPSPSDDDVLVRVRATTVNRTDCGFRRARPVIVRPFSGFVRPRRRILGSEFSGVVESVGTDVKDFAVGDEVFGVNAETFGANAEYLCMPHGGPLALKPDGMPFDEAASIPDGGVLALSCLRSAGVHGGQRVLVYGASGSIGTAGVQLAKHFGAHVTAVCDAKGIQTVSSLGPDQVVDYTEEDFTQNCEKYDVIFDAVGKHSYRRCRGSLESRGVFVETDLGFMWHTPALVVVTRVIGSHRVAMPIPRYTKQKVQFLGELVEAGEYRAVIDRRYPLEQVVEATRYVETEQKIGNVVLTVSTPRT